MQLSWQSRRMIAVVVGGALALTYPLWGAPFTSLLAWLTGPTGGSGHGSATVLTLIGMVVGGLIASVPAAAAGVAWLVGDAAQATGRGKDAGRMTPLPSERRHAFSWLRLGGWLLVFGMLVGMMFSASDVFQSWAGAFEHLVDRVNPDLGARAADAVAAMLQAFPFSVLGLFVYSLITTFVPQRWNRWPGDATWIPWRAMAIGAVVWLACALVAVLPAYLQLP